MFDSFFFKFRVELWLKIVERRGRIERRSSFLAEVQGFLHSK